MYSKDKPSLQTILQNHERVNIYKKRWRYSKDEQMVMAVKKQVLLRLSYGLGLVHFKYDAQGEENINASTFDQLKSQFHPTIQNNDTQKASSR